MNRHVKKEVALAGAAVIAALVTGLVFHAPGAGHAASAGVRAVRPALRRAATVSRDNRPIRAPNPARPVSVRAASASADTARAGAWIELGTYQTSPGVLDVGVMGGGFAPAEMIDLSLVGSNSRASASLQADHAGAVSGRARLLVPPNLSGPLQIIATGRDSRRVATATVGVLPYVPLVSLSRYAALPGQSVAVQAQGFAPRESVDLVAGTTVLERTRTEVDGSVHLQVAYTVPYTATAGYVPLAIRSVAGQRSAWQRLYVVPLRPWATASSYVVRAGDRVQFEAHGFASGELVTVYLGGAAVGHGTQTTDAQGNVGGLGPFPVPSDDAQPAFSLVGARSGARTVVTLTELK